MKLSVIIPVYNVEQYLPECIKSVLGQDFTDLEVIAVNDGSTDGSLKILESYPAVKIINQDNSGSGVARNAGLHAAQGEYVYFLDGDDWLEKDTLIKMVETIEKDNLDILIFGGVSCKDYKKSDGGYSFKKFPKKWLNRVFSAQDIKKDLFKFPSTAWTKLYRRDFLLKNNIKFQEIKVGQDQLFFIHSMITADRIAILAENLYCYRKNRQGSAMTVANKKNFSPIYVFYAVEELLQQLGKIEDYEKVFVNRYFSKATSWLGKFEAETKKEYFAEYKKLHKHVKKTYPQGWWTKFNPKITDSYWLLKYKKFMVK